MLLVYRPDGLPAAKIGLLAGYRSKAIWLARRMGVKAASSGPI
jgi:hypothetical protein